MEQPTKGFGTLIILAVLATTVLVMELGLHRQAAEEKTALESQHSAQEAQLAEATKLRQQANAIAQGTAQLAEAGDPNARAIIDYLRSQGVAVNPQPAK